MGGNLQYGELNRHGEGEGKIPFEVLNFLSCLEEDMGISQTWDTDNEK